MAIAHRIGPHRDLALKLDWPGFDAELHHVVLVAGTQGYRLDVTGVGEDGWLRLGSASLGLERAAVEHAEEALQLLVTDHLAQARVAIEPLAFHQSFFAPMVDFAAMPLHGFDPRTCTRPALLAVCTHVYNDPVMARLWERHYARYVPQAHLYVIDHGSDVPASSVLSTGTQVVRLPRGPTDHANIAQFCNHFQRFLLSQYRWVLHVDADELIVAEAGEASFMARLSADTGPPRIVSPAHAVDLVMHPDLDTPLDLSRPITLQRRHLVPNADYRKPVLVSRPTTWGPGFHFAVESFDVVEEPGLWLVHLDKVDLALALARHRNWLATPRSAVDDARVDHTHRAATEEVQRTRLLEALASPDAVEMPAWMRGRF